MRIASYFLAVVACAAVPSAAEPAKPDAIAEIEAGERNDANAAWWGFDPADATEAVQSAIDSGAERVVIPYTAQPWIVRPIALRSNLELVFEPGVVVAAKPGEFRGKGDSLFTARAAENITLIGYGATLRMRKTDYIGTDYQPSEWRMAIRLMSCKNVTIEGLRVESSGGDGVYVGVDSSVQPWCEDITIRDAVFDDHHRQGISVISCDGLLIENVVLSNTGGTAPAAGIDFEPNEANERLVDCVMRNCTVRGNEGAGIQFYLNNLTAESEAVSIRVENCLVQNNGHAGLLVGAINQNGPAGEIRFVDCTVENQSGGIHIYDKAPNAAKLVFEDCRILMREEPEDMKGRTAPAILFRARRVERAPVFGNIQFRNCTVWVPRDLPTMEFRQSNEQGTITDISGDITIFSPDVPGFDMPPGTHFPEFTPIMERTP